MTSNSRLLTRPPVIAFVVLLVSGCLVVLPRPTASQIVPLPHPSASREREVEVTEIERANEAVKTPLDNEARAIGELVRRAGEMLAKKDRTSADVIMTLREDALALLRAPQGEERLLRLRALQAELFLQALDGWKPGQPAPKDVEELGGPFATFAPSWRDERGTFVVSRNELRLSFRIYWSRLVGLDKVHPFSPSLDEVRRYYRTRVLYPDLESADAMSANLARLSYIQALSRVDPDYPGELAQAVLELRLGRANEAQRLIAAHKLRRGDGPWGNIARNTDLAAAKLLASESIP